LKITEVTQSFGLLLSALKSHAKSLTKNGLRYILGDFLLAHLVTLLVIGVCLDCAGDDENRLLSMRENKQGIVCFFKRT
jgi:hypothetical protein